MTNLAANTYTTKITIPNVLAKSDRVFTNNWAVRVKYVGPLIDRGGVGYIISGVDAEDTKNINDVSYHPHCYQKAITSNWFYLRMKPLVHFLQHESEGPSITPASYMAFEGLPANKACMLVEAILI